MKRRDFLKSAGLIAAGVAVSQNSFAGTTMPSVSDTSSESYSGDLNNSYPPKPLKADVNRQISVVVIGIGNRGSVYARYSKKFPHVMKVAGIVDNNVQRLERYGKDYGVPKERLFKSLEEFYATPKFCDAVIISTPDHLHYEPSLKVMQMGYHLLLEKPMCQTEKECRDVLEMAHKTGRIVGLCHVLRFAPYFVALRGAIQSGIIGEVVNVQHMEPIEHKHMAHSYVRGNWPLADKTTPIILAKSCHDLDIMRWLVNKPCEVISAEGSLHLFRKENMPEGATERCTDGCPHEKECPYSAIHIYVEKQKHIHVFDLPRKDPNLILEKLKTTNYGRCVYRCENDQCDHYVATIRFKDNVTASFTMDAFTPWGGRRTRIMGTTGYIEGDGTKFTLYTFRDNKKRVWHKNVKEMAEYKHAGHGGGDHALARDFVEAVAAQDPTKLSSTIDASIESHIIGFKAEKSRLSMKKVKI